MANTVIGLDADNQDITLFSCADKTKYVLIDSKNEGNGRESLYQRADGNPEYPASVRVGHYPNPKGLDGFGLTNISFKFSTFVEYDDGVNAPVYRPCAATLAWTMPGSAGVVDNATQLKFLQNLLSFALHIDAGVVDADVLDELKYGITNSVMSHIDT